MASEEDELRRELAEVRRELAKLLELLRHVPAAITLLRGPELVIEFAHPLAIAALGGRALEGRPLLEAVPEFADQPHVARMRRVLETGETSIETVAVQAQNQPGAPIEQSYWHSTYQAIPAVEGHVDRLLTFDIDVTEEVQQRKRLEILQSLASALAVALSTAEVARAVIEHGAEKLGANRGGIWTLSPDRTFLELVYDRGYSTELRESVRRVPVDSPLPLARVLATREPCFVASRSEYAARFGEISAETYLVRTSEETSFICAPLVVEGKPIGCVSFNYDAVHAYGEGERRLVTALVDQCAIALHRAELVSSERRERTRFRAVFESSQDGILLMDASMIVIDANPAACALLRRSREEMIGMPSREFVTPDERATHLARIEELRRASHLPPVERRMAMPDGSTRLFEVSLSMNVDAGVALSTFRDVEDRKRAEENLKFLEQASTMFAGSLDPEKTLAMLARLAVPRLADWVAIDMLDEGGGERRVVVEHVDPDKLAVARAIHLGRPTAPETTLQRIARTGEPLLVERLTDAMLEAYATDPEYLALVRSVGLFSIMIIPLFVRGAARGAITFAFAESHRQYGGADVRFAQELARRASAAFDNALAYRDLQQAYEAEASALRKKDEFLAMLGHELRNPLAPIVTATSLIRMRGKASDRELDILERQSKHLVRLVDDLLDVSRITAGKIALRRQPLDLRDVVAQALENASKAFEDKKLRVEMRTPPAPLVVDGDHDRLVQVVTNVLVNAAKFTPPERGVHIAIEREGDAARIEIRDEGEGIAPDVLPGIFAPFAQAPQAMDRRDGGLGLGLSIARGLVDAHGGTIDAASPGRERGATITIRLPLGKGEPANATARTGPRAERARRVLVVDDNEDAAGMIAAFLESVGFETRTASDGPEALALTASAPFDVAVMDIGLPGMDGYELASELRARLGDHAPKLIALTGYAQITDRDRAVESGFAAHFAKPVDLDKLVSAIAAAVPAEAR